MTELQHSLRRENMRLRALLAKRNDIAVESCRADALDRSVRLIRRIYNTQNIAGPVCIEMRDVIADTRRLVP